MHLGRLANSLLLLRPRNGSGNGQSLLSFSKTQTRSLIGFGVVYVLLVIYCQVHVFRDPGSYFFTVEGYRPGYSADRLEQVRAFLDHLGTDHDLSSTGDGPRNPPTLCIGMATAKRPVKQYVDVALASLFDHLSQQERSEIEMNLLIAHARPYDHPSMTTNETTPWAALLADHVWTYNNSGQSRVQVSQLRHLERTREYNKKSFHDYALLLRKCQDSGASWVLMLEDDVLAQEGWYARTMESVARLDHPPRQANDWLYLRLFYTEKFLGWNSESWPSYLAWSIAVVASTAGIGLYLHHRFSSATPFRLSLPSSPPLSPEQPLFSPLFIATISLVCVPAIILLYFAAGRMTVQPLTPGIHSMNRFGCCSQALLFPRDMSLQLTNWFETILTADDDDDDDDDDDTTDHLPGAVDSAIEIFADDRNLQRWALAPSAFQHVGAQTFKAGSSSAHDRFDISGARGIWNFRFEQHRSLSRPGP
jgi:hypothetical protein